MERSRTNLTTDIIGTMSANATAWLPSRSRFVRDRNEQEAESGPKWVQEFNARARKRLWRAYQNATAQHSFIQLQVNEDLYDFVTENSQLELTVRSYEDALTGKWDSAGDEELLDWIAAVAIVLRTRLGLFRQSHILNTNIFNSSASQRIFIDPAQRFIDLTNDVLLDERIAYAFVNNQLVPRGDQPLHSELIVPTEAKLSSDPRFQDVEKAFNEAVSALANGSYGASIVSSASSIEATLKALGAAGNDLGSRFASARKMGLFKGHDEKLMNAIKSLTDWATADRSGRGITHGASDAQRHDAELTRNISTAVVLRLIQLKSEPDAVPEEE